MSSPAPSTRLALPLVALAGTLACFAAPSPAFGLTLLAFGMATLYWPRSTTRRYGLDAGVRDSALLALATAMLVVGVKDDVIRLLFDGTVRVSNVYHYYLGAKYAPELGYTDLYAATLAADREGEGYWEQAIDEVRDLESYRIVPREELAARYQPELAFSAERWSEFKDDVAAFSHRRRAKRWRNVFRDRGYNATPLWTVVGRSIAALVPAASPWLPLVALLDIILLALTAVLVARTFGRTQAILVLLLFVASPTNITRLTGGFLQTDWLCAITCSLCCYRRQRPGVAGALMAYAVMTRVFPLLLVAGACLPVVRQALSERRFPRLPRRLARYLLSVATFCLLGLALSLANGRGAAAWFEFVEAIELHRGEHVLGERRIGLEHAFTGDFAHFPAAVDREQRAELLHNRQLLAGATKILMLALLLAAATRRTAWNAQLLALAAVFALLVLSRYYYGTLALMPLLSVGEAPRRRFLAGGQMAVFLLVVVAIHFGAGWHASYALFNVLLALYFAGACIIGLHSAHRSRSAARSGSQPPPKSVIHGAR